MDKPQPEEELKKFPKVWLCSYRFFLTLMICLGLLVTGLMRVSISMAMICMINGTAVALESPISTENEGYNSSHTQVGCEAEHSVVDQQYDGPIIWFPETQSAVFAAFFYGALVGIIPAGYLSDRFNPVHMYTGCVVVYIVCCLLTPVAAVYHYGVVVFLRLLMGISEGMIQPCISSILARWIPPDERSTVIGIYTAGNQLCMVIGMPLFAYLCTRHDILEGWPSIYYLSAFCGIPWCVIWFIFISTTPVKNKFISKDELSYIEHTLKHQGLRHKKHTTIPWKGLLTSKAIWACNVANFASYFCVYTLQTYLPQYFKDVLNLNLNANGFFSALPFLVKWLVKFGTGYGADLMTRKTKWSRSTICKIFNTLGCIGPAVFFVACSFLDCTQIALAIVFLCIANGFTAGYMAGAMTSAQSLAPQYSGVVRSWTGIFNQLAGLAAPYTVGALVNEGNQEEWQRVFFTVTGIMIVAGIFFDIFGSAEIEDWAKAPPPKEVRMSDILHGLHIKTPDSLTRLQQVLQDHLKTHIAVIQHTPTTESLANIVDHIDTEAEETHVKL